MAAVQAKASLILTGNVTHGEFAPVMDWLSAHYATTVVSEPGNVIATPQAVLMFEGHPLQYSQAWVEKWANSFPLTRLIAIHGSWNEGELRSGFPLQGITRLYWHEARNRLPKLLRNPLIPRTANYFDNCERFCENQPSTFLGSVQIATTHVSEYDILADMALLLGLTPHRLQAINIAETSPPSFWIWSGNDTLQNSDFALFSHLKQHWPEIPGIAIMNFPRVSEYNFLSNYGVQFLLAKPFLLCDFQHICQGILQ